MCAFFFAVIIRKLLSLTTSARRLLGAAINALQIMSFLLPSIRNAVRTNLRRSPAILRQQRISPLNPLRPEIVRMFRRPYSQQPPGSNKPSTPDNPSNPQSSDPSNPPSDPVGKGGAVPPESRSNQDPFSGDLPAAPGSVLAQFTGTAEEGRGVEPSTGGPGQMPKKEEYKSSTDRKRERLAKFFMYGFLASVVGGSIWLGRPIEEAEREIMGLGDVWHPLSIVTNRSYPRDSPPRHTGNDSRDEENLCLLYLNPVSIDLRVVL